MTGIIVDFLKSIAGICRTKPLDPTMWAIRGNTITIDLKNVPDLQNVGGAVFLKGKELKTPLLVIRKQDQGYLVVENRCTHMGRKLDPEPDGKTIRCCSVSHSTFDYYGEKLTGPAKGPIRVYESREEQGRLVVELT